MDHEIYLGLLDLNTRLSGIEEILIKAKLMEAPKVEKEPKEEKPETKKKSKAKF